MKSNILFDTITESADDTEMLGSMLAEKIMLDSSLPHFVAFYGDLGVGKTVFIRGFISKFSPSAKISSPTYSIVHEYHDSKIPLFHFDMYRIKDDDDLFSVGYYEYIEQNGICLAEWSENIPFALPESYIKVSISKPDTSFPDKRKITVQIV